MPNDLEQANAAAMVGVAKAINALSVVCHMRSYDAGWWHCNETGLPLKPGDAPEGFALNEQAAAFQKAMFPYIVATKLMLTVSEVSEGMEGHRKGLQDDKLPDRAMIEVELADAIIRICDLAGALNLDVGGAIAAKIDFNAVRPDHKAGNRRKPGGKAY
jgi:NTP pyrophosphatase (non-canonical NTP hydrolase)